jgi:hypothetical protein
MLLKDLNDYSANTKWAKMEPGNDLFRGQANHAVGVARGKNWS